MGTLCLNSFGCTEEAFGREVIKAREHLKGDFEMKRNENEKERSPESGVKERKTKAKT
jgi:hypothetical protein